MVVSFSARFESLLIVQSHKRVEISPHMDVGSKIDLQLSLSRGYLACSPVLYNK